MCLWIAFDSKSKTSILRDCKKPIKAYKVLRRTPSKQLVSPYWCGSTWEPGKVQTSDRHRLKNPAQITRVEKQAGRIYKGLHFFTTRKEARDAKQTMWCSRNLEIWVVEIKPGDVISAGDFNGARNVAAHKAKLIRKA